MGCGRSTAWFELQWHIIPLFKEGSCPSLDSQPALPNTGQLNRSMILLYRSSRGEEAAVVSWIIHVVDHMVRPLQHALTSLPWECFKVESLKDECHRGIRPPSLQDGHGCTLPSLRAGGLPSII